jgi:hypothetical protein
VVIVATNPENAMVEHWRERIEMRAVRSLPDGIAAGGERDAWSRRRRGAVRHASTVLPPPPPPRPPPRLAPAAEDPVWQGMATAIPTHARNRSIGTSGGASKKFMVWRLGESASARHKLKRKT